MCSICSVILLLVEHSPDQQPRELHYDLGQHSIVRREQLPHTATASCHDPALPALGWRKVTCGDHQSEGSSPSSLYLYTARYVAERATYILHCSSVGGAATDG